MLGLRPENDRGHAGAGNGLHATTGYRKSYRFAGQLSGRFFVAGISGSLKKHHQQLQETDKKYLNNTTKNTTKYTYEPVLEKKEKDELRREAERLLAMEEQLKEMQRLKELKRQRERGRRRKKMEFQSAVSIQSAVRRYFRRCKDRAADVVLSFLRAMAAQQAVAAAAWASAVLGRFAKRCAVEWRYKQWYRQQARQAAADNWHVISEVACIWTQARRRTADECVFYCLKTAQKQAVGQILINQAEAVERRRFKLLKLQKRKQNLYDQQLRDNKKNWYADKSKHKDSNLQFFLTEFDSGGLPIAAAKADSDECSTVGEDELMAMSCDSDDALSLGALRHKYCSSPGKKPPAAGAAAAGAATATAATGATAKHVPRTAGGSAASSSHAVDDAAAAAAAAAAAERRAKKEFDEAVKERHMRRVQEMEEERKRRLKDLEEVRLSHYSFIVLHFSLRCVCVFVCFNHLLCC